NNSYDIGVLDFMAAVSPQQTNLKINHDIIKGELKSNVNPQLLTSAIEDYFMRYTTDSIAIDSTLVDANALLNLQMHVKNGPLLNKVLLPGLEAMDTINLALDFDQSKESLSAHVNVPHLNYTGNVVDSLELDILGASKVMDLELEWAGIHAGPVAMGKTLLNAAYKNQNLEMQFRSMDSLSAVVDV